MTSFKRYIHTLKFYKKSTGNQSNWLPTGTGGLLGIQAYPNIYSVFTANLDNINAGVQYGSVTVTYYVEFKGTYFP